MIQLFAYGGLMMIGGLKSESILLQESFADGTKTTLPL
jgi:hypothetical protein